MSADGILEVSMKPTFAWVVLVAGLSVTGCGDEATKPSVGGNNGGGQNGGGGQPSMRATLDGTTWVASQNNILVTGSASPTVQGSLTITGIETSTGVAITLSLAYIAAPGTFPSA